MSMQVTSTVDQQRAVGLRRMKAFATGLLAVMAVIFVLAWIGQDRYPWLGYVRAAAEAGMVGALADWFAVTALFKHPLGLPIPHTAIIPERKAALGESLSEFVAENFMNEQVVRDKLAGLNLARRGGAWLSQEAGATRVTQELSAGLRGVIDVLDDDDVGQLMAGMIRRKVGDMQVGPPLGRILDDVVRQGDHHDLVNVLIERIHEWVVTNEQMIAYAVRNRAPSWSPPFLDQLVGDKLFREIERFIRDVRYDPKHQIRAALDQFLSDLARDLQHDPTTIERADRVKHRIIDNPQVQTLVSGAWASAKQAILEAADNPESELRSRATATIRQFGQRLVDDAELAGKVDRWISDLAGYTARRYARDVAGIIDETVAKWDGEATSRKIELLVGRDLQFIRINGTVVGALAGLMIYTLAHNLLG